MYTLMKIISRDNEDFFSLVKYMQLCTFLYIRSLEYYNLHVLVQLSCLFFY